MAYGDKGEMLCFKACDAPGDCPAGQGCYQEGNASACKPACRNDDDCPVGIQCVSGSCMRAAGNDGGCTLCDDRDGSLPAGPDAAAPLPPPPSGCGCSTGDAASALLLGCLFLFVPMLRRRSAARS